MYKNIGGLFIAVGVLFFSANFAYADVSSVHINLEIESTTGTLFNGPLDVTACPETQGSGTTTINAFCALDQSGVPVTWSWYGDDAFLDTISGTGNDYGLNLYWLWFTDLEAGVTSFNKHILHDGEKILVTIGRMPMKMSASTLTPTVGATTTITVSEFGFDSSWNSVWLPSASSTVSWGGELLTTDGTGTAVFTATSTDSVVVAAVKDGFLNPESLAITPAPAPLPSLRIALDLESTTGTLFNGPLDVTACPETQGSGTTTINAFCALDQSGVPVTWSWYGDDAFLDTISGTGNDYGLNLYWLWFTDLEAGVTSFNKHILHDGEKILVTIGRMPMKMSASTLTPTVGATTTITVSEFGFDSSWNSVWLPSASSTVSWGGELLTTDGTGTAVFTATSTDSVIIAASKAGFLTPESLTLIPVAAATSTATTTVTTTTNTGGGGGFTAHTQFNIAQAYAYLSGVEHTDGSFGSDMVTDWVAVTLGDGAAPQGLKDHMRAYLVSHTPTLVSATDYERHAMALLAHGIDPQNAGGVNYIQKITSRFDGVQIGDSGLVNDDIFALFPLAHTGYTAGDDVIKKTIQFIISKQSAGGEWESVDLTAAAVQALSLFSGEPGVPGAISKARTFLKTSQQGDAGWGNTFSTSWAVQAIAALGEISSTWMVGVNAPQDALQAVQKSDGSVGAISDSEMTKVWGTAYAIPGVSGKTWNVLMSSFPKSGTIAGSSGLGEVVQATTTLPAATTTKDTLIEAVIATTTPDMLKTIATSIATTTSQATKQGSVKKNTTVKKTAATPEIKHSNQEAKVPENPTSSFIATLFTIVGHSVKKLFSWIF